MIATYRLHVGTKGQGDALDITGKVGESIERSGIRAGVTTRAGKYCHHLCWGDDNGSSHVRAAILGPSLTVPFVDAALTLGTWQQIMLLEFDTRPRERKVVVQILGE